MSSSWPRGFLFGAATAAHQVEGGNRNDWTAWEKANAPRFATSARARSWPEHILKGGSSPLDPENYISGRACDHYHRYEEDFDIARQLGHTAHRFSIEWARIEPEEGTFDEREIEHYRAVVRALRARGIEPFVTLWHWTIPLWLRDEGGILAKRFPEYFARYAARIAAEIPEARFWITLNEPELWATHAYYQGAWPPQRRNPFALLRALRRLAAAHRRAYRAMKASAPQCQIGIAKHNIYFEAVGGRAWNRLLKWIADRWWNRSFLMRIRNEQDFIGLNYYLHNRIDGWFGKNENKRRSEFLDWELFPEGITQALLELKRFGRPIYVTENGLADARDRDRAWYIAEALAGVRRALDAGADVRGYLHWSLLDNFEWDKGFWPRFGLVAVDRTTLERTIRPSAWNYKELIERA